MPDVNKLLNIGVTEGLSATERRHVRFVNGLMGGVLVFIAVYVLVMALAGGPPSDLPTTALAVLTCLAVLALNRAGRYQAARMAVVFGLGGQAAWAAWSLPEAHTIRISLLLVAFTSSILPRGGWERPVTFAASLGGFMFLEMDGTFSLPVLAHVLLFGAVLYLLGHLYVRESDRAVEALMQQQTVLKARDVAISTQNERLTALNTQLHDIAQTTEEQARRLDAMNTMKDRIVSVLSHDLRGPLSSLDALLEAYEEGAFTAAEVAALVPETRRTVNATREQLDDVLTWARTLLSGADPHATTWLAEAVRRSSVQFAGRADLKHIRLRHDIPDGLGVAAEPASVLLLLRNLMGNALKFTPPGGEIHVGAVRQGDGCVLRVRDSGVGMSQERVARLNGGAGGVGTTLGTGGEKGSGLGLVLCREVAQHFGGTLLFESAEGEGTSATVVFPLARTGETVAV